MDIERMSIARIKEMVRESDAKGKIKMIEAMEGDRRVGVRAIASRLRTGIDEQKKEIDRINAMKSFEREWYVRGAKYIAGIDEVGRGPLAGPVYAGAVVFARDTIIEGVNDSKKLSAAKRQMLSAKIRERAVAYAVGYCDERTIDRINILNATFEAMKMAVINLSVRPDVLLIDAVRIPGLEIPQVPIVKGDSLSFSIAAASIIAKVERDRVMDEYDRIYPNYNFAHNKGYGTEEHMDAIRRFGPCPIHRKSFISGIK